MTVAEVTSMFTPPDGQSYDHALAAFVELLKVVKHTGAVLKPKADLQERCVRRVIFLGIELLWSGQQLQWNVPIDKRREIVGLPVAATSTYRQVAKITGSLGWCNYIGGMHIGWNRMVYDILVRTSKAAQQIGWDQCAGLKLEEIEELKRQQGLWEPRRQFKMAGTQAKVQHFVVSDASMERFGYLLFNANDVCYRGCRRPYGNFMSTIYRGEFEHYHIFLLEFIAALVGVKDIESRYGPCNIVIVSDNMALVQVINQEWTRDELGKELLDALFVGHSDVKAMWIPTELNPSDGLTREDLGYHAGDVTYAIELMKQGEYRVSFNKIVEIECSSE
jgi:hypothetical protein